MSEQVLVLGAGGHATVVVDLLRQLNYDIVGIVTPREFDSNPVFKGVNVYLDDRDVLNFDQDKILLVNGIGSLPGDKTRSRLHVKFKNYGFSFLTLIAPTAIVSSFVGLSEGVQIMPGAIINANSSVGEGTIVNSGAVVEHDCHIGPHNHLAPGCRLSGNVSTGAFVHVGTGAVLIQNVTVGNEAVVGAGAALTRDLSHNEKLLVAKPHLLSGET